MVRDWTRRNMLYLRMRLKAAYQRNKFSRESLTRLLNDIGKLQNAQIFELPLANMLQPMRFILMCPDPDEICPITQEPIAVSQLSFMDTEEVQSLNPMHSDRNAIRLPCSHQFTALCLVYHWLLNRNVKCPLCRAGFKLRLMLKLRLMPSSLNIWND